MCLNYKKKVDIYWKISVTFIICGKILIFPIKRVPVHANSDLTLQNWHYPMIANHKTGTELSLFLLFFTKYCLYLHLLVLKMTLEWFQFWMQHKVTPPTHQRKNIFHKIQSKIDTGLTIDHISPTIYHTWQKGLRMEEVLLISIL